MSAAKQIPVVDLVGLGVGQKTFDDGDQVLRVARQLDEAFSTVGFVYLTNHGIPQEKIESVFKASKVFFNLSKEEKNHFKRALDKNDGYVGQNQEILDSRNRVEIREAYNCTSLDASPYPDDYVPEFRTSIADLAEDLSELTRRLLKCLALALGLDEDFYVNRHQFMLQGASKNATTFRTLYYPSLNDYCAAELNGDEAQLAAQLAGPGVVRCGQHSDYGTITLLLQDDMGGLEVLSEGQWIPAPPIHGSILVNLGDLMQFWTSDRYLATVHRVLVPAEEFRRRIHRQSVAFFVHPDNEVMIAPLIPDGTSKKHEPVGALEYLKSRLSASYKF